MYLTDEVSAAINRAKSEAQAVREDAEFIAANPIINSAEREGISFGDLQAREAAARGTFIEQIAQINAELAEED